MDWTLFWAAVSAGLTALSAGGSIATAVVASRQLSLLARQSRDAHIQERGWRTLAACERYESDPVLDRCLRNIFSAKQSMLWLENPAALRIDVTTILNYLDGIATGIEQRLYVTEIVRDQLEPIVKWHVGEYLEPAKAKAIGIDPAEFPRLIAICEQWSREPPRYRSDGMVGV